MFRSSLSVWCARILVLIGAACGLVGCQDVSPPADAAVATALPVKVSPATAPVVAVPLATTSPLTAHFHRRAPLDAQRAEALRLERRVQLVVDDPDLLDDWMGELRTSRPRMPDGRSTLGFVGSLVHDLLTSGARMAAANRLRRERPTVAHYVLSDGATQARITASVSKAAPAQQLAARVAWYESQGKLAEGARDAQAYVQALKCCEAGDLDDQLRLRLLKAGLAVDPFCAELVDDGLARVLFKPTLAAWLDALRAAVPPEALESAVARVALVWAADPGATDGAPSLPWPSVAAGLRRRLAGGPMGVKAMWRALICAACADDRDLGRAVGDRLEGLGTWGMGEAPGCAVELLTWVRDGTALPSDWMVRAATTLADTDPPPRRPLTPGVVVPPRPDERRLSWAHRTFIDEYVAHGVHDPRWDAEVVDALTRWARLSATSALRDPAFSRRLAEDMSFLVASGCKDPMIRYIETYLSQTFLRRSRDESARRYLQVAPEVEASDYAAPRKEVAWLMAASGARRLRQPEDAERCLKRSGVHTLAVLSDHTVPPWRALSTALDAHRRKSVPDEQLSKALSIWPPETGVHEAFSGILSRAAASEARGTDVARNVSQAQWTTMRRHLADAERDLRAAWAKNPTLVEVASTMVSLCLHAQHPRAEAETWFERARSVDPTDTAAYEAMLIYLLPQWYGSKEDVLAFAERVAVWQRELSAPDLLDTVLWSTRWLARNATWAGGPSSTNEPWGDRVTRFGPWREPRVRKLLQSALSCALSQTAGTTYEKGARTETLVHALYMGAHDLANRQFDAVGLRLSDEVDQWGWAQQRIGSIAPPLVTKTHPLPPVPTTEAALRTDLSRMITAGDIPGLEGYVRRLRSPRTALDNGRSGLEAAYESLISLFTVLDQGAGRENRLSRTMLFWCHLYTESVSAAAVNLLTLDAQTMPDHSGPHRFLRNAADVPAPLRVGLARGRAATLGDPHAWVALFRCADDLDLTEDERSAMLERALREAADYPPLAEAYLGRPRGLMGIPDDLDEALISERFRALRSRKDAAGSPSFRTRAAEALKRLLGEDLAEYYTRDEA